MSDSIKGFTVALATDVGEEEADRIKAAISMIRGVDEGQTGLSQLLSGCMIAAIDAAVVFRDYAQAKGISITLSEESIQDMAAAALIHLQKMADMECRYQVKAEQIMGRVQQNGGAASWKQ